MDYQTAFTASDINFGMIHIVPILLFLGAILFLLLIFYVKIEEKNKLFARSFSVVFVIVTFLFMISDLPANYKALNKFENIFELGNYKTIEGEIQKFKEYHDSEIDGSRMGYWNNTFWVKDVYFHLRSNFHYYKNDSHPNKGRFYNYIGRLNGHVNKNGQQVRISYIVEDDKNKIIKFEVRK